jgi:hypothetical protein
MEERILDYKFVCPCGLFCTDCLFYKKEIFETANKLKKVIKDSQFDIFLNLLVKHNGSKNISKHFEQENDYIENSFKPFKKLDDFFEVLDGIINLQCKKTCQEAG